MLKFQKKMRRATLLGSTAAFVASVAATGAIAQDADSDEDLEDFEEVVVTGTRIARQDLTAPSPVTSIGAIDLNLSNTINVESFLNSLPQTIPGNDGSSNNPGTGEADVNLRGLGAGRTLVLVNGRRYVTSNQTGTVDLNTIPTALVERVDVVTGGASAVYGSDAVAGVVNFIMKDDFEGVQFDSTYEITGSGDGGIFNSSITVGGNFADGRGNAVMYAQYSHRESVLQGARPNTAVTLNDIGTGFSETGSVNIPSTFVLDFGSVNYTAALGIAPEIGADGALTCTPEGTALSDDGTFCTTDTFGFVFDPAGGGGPGVFINGGPNNNRFNYAPDNFLQLPAERFTVASFADYEINDNVRFYTRGIYTASFVDQLLAPTPIFTTLTINLDNPFITPESVIALESLGGVGDADGNGVDDVVVTTGRRLQELGGRRSSGKNDALQIAGGFDGSINDTWNFDIYGHYNRGDTFILQTGNVSRSAYQAVVRENRANIFSPGGITEDIAAEISRTGAIRGTVEQINLSASMAGDLPVTLPWADGAIATAFGVEYRDESLEAIPDSVLGPDVAGFNQAPEVRGSFDVKEAFAEIVVPIAQGKQFAEELTLNLAGRLSDYSSVGTVETYAVGMSWSPIEDIRFRGQYQRAVRAPSIGELFSPQTNGFPNIADPCSGGTNGNFDNLTAAQQTTATANCIANGVPAAAVGTPFQPNAQIEGLFGGNPTLFEETSDTWTVGAVISPSFAQGLNITVDYYDITIDDAIANVPSQTIFDECFLNGVQGFCDAIDRRASGQVDIFRSTALNTAELVARGFDFTVEYTFDTANLGSFRFHVLGNYTSESSFRSTPAAEVIDCAGFYGPTCGEPTPEWSFNTTVDWSYGDLGARVRWVRVGSVTDDTPGSENFFVPGVDSRNYVDLTLDYQVAESLNLIGGIRNVLGTDHVLIGDASAEQSNTFPATYETLGRQFFFGFSAKF